MDTSVLSTNGIAGGYTGDNVNILRAMIAFSAIAWYNCAELIFLICLRFKKWKGLYFWSLMVTSWAIVIYQIGSWGKMRNIAGNPTLMTVFTNVGWIVMITGNSLVLYSRLHLLCQNHTLLKWVLYGIMINTVCMYIPTTALDIGSNVVNPGNRTYINGYSIMERIQMTMFTVQEFVISGIYLIEAYRYLKVAYVGDKRSRNVMYELLAVNVTIIILDIALLSVAHRDLFQIEVTLKGLVYSVKLKLELGVLSRLVRIVTGSGSALGRTATFDNDLANLSDESKAFNGLEFCTTPLPEKHNSADSKRSSQFRDFATVDTHRSSVPWLMTNTRSVLPESPRPSRQPTRRLPTNGRPYSLPDRHLTSTRRRTTTSSTLDSPFRPPPVQRPTHNTVQRGESFANSEFLTSAAVTEGANDETLRQFQKEIEAELGGGALGVAELTHHKSAEGSEETLTSGMSLGKDKAGKVGKREGKDEDEGEGEVRSEGEEEEEEEEEWARGLGVLGRPVPSRESSLGRMYPGRITGENG